MALEAKLTGEEILSLWQQCFPGRLEKIGYRCVCETIRLIVERRAADYSQTPDDILDAVDHVLTTLGIPCEEFYQFERETEDH